MVKSEGKKRGTLSEKHWLGGWFGSIQTEPNSSVEIVVEKLNRCNPKKTGYTFRETLVGRLVFTEPNSSVEIMVEKLNRCNPKKNGVYFLRNAGWEVGLDRSRPNRTHLWISWLKSWTSAIWGKNWVDDQKIQNGTQPKKFKWKTVNKNSKWKITKKFKMEDKLKNSKWKTSLKIQTGR